MLNRPMPPQSLVCDIPEGALFIAAPDLERWAFATFIDEGAPLENAEHVHLQEARLGFLWAGVENARQAAGPTIAAADIGFACGNCLSN